MIDTLQRKSRIYAIDLMRAICILYIVGFWHLLNYTKAIPGYNNLITERLTIIVLGLFTLLSGYLMGTRVNGLERIEFVQFYRARMFRIFPPFLFALILFYLMDISDPGKLIKAACLISMFSAPTPSTLWYIAMIMIFYLLAPLLAAMSSDTRKYAAICAVILTAILVYDKIFHSVDLRIALYFLPFAIGILFVRRGTLLYKINPLFFIFLLFLCATSVLISLTSFASIPKKLLPLPLALFGPLVIFTVIMKGERRIGYSRIIGVISYASYFMFLFHRPVYIILKRMFFPASLGLQVLYLLVVGLPSIVAASWLGQKAYDRIMLNFSGCGMEKIPAQKAIVHQSSKS